MENLKDVLGSYLSAKQFELSRSTQDTLSRAVSLFLTFDPRPVRCIDRPAVDSWKNWLVGGGRAKTTANMYLRSLRSMANYAVEAGWLGGNPFKGIKQFAVAPRPVTVYEEWQFCRMLRFVPKATRDDPVRDLRWLALLWGARTTGFRRGAILNLTWVNIRGGMVWSEPKSATSTTWPWSPKVPRNYRVPLAPQFRDVLEELKDHHYPHVAPKMYERMLARQKAGSLPARWCKCPEQNFRRTFNGIQARAFGQVLGDFHQLRRTYCSDLAEILPDKALMELTDHTKRSTLDRYTTVRQSHYDLALDRLSAIGKARPHGLQLPLESGLPCRP